MARAREFDADATLDRCLDLFWAKGFAGVSIRDLEQATGLGRQSLYSAFGNKEALFAAVLDRYSAATEAWLAPLFTDAAGLASLRQYAVDALAAQRTHGCHGCLVVKTLWDRGIADQSMRKRAQAATRRVRAAFEHALDRAVAHGEIVAGDNEQRADLCFAAMNGLAALRQAGVTEARARTTFEQLLDSWRT
ncbi:MAG: TetR/AcrR family transcriptional regulator [Planctomycetes bacterium]|nr:TetR/AcrR family transcriptional regulator [Planctomycetota bacterium]MCB9889810.1 TetR/AcrR family transcriptional regulator [Planctomycetota bacterium]